MEKGSVATRRHRLTQDWPLLVGCLCWTLVGIGFFFLGLVSKSKFDFWGGWRDGFFSLESHFHIF